MKKRMLGNSGLEVSVLALGGNVFGWTADEAASYDVLDAYADAGGNLIDTADMYSTWVPGHRGGESEIIIGKWLKRRGGRERMVIATKVGMELGPGQKGLSRSYIMQAVQSSLQRLQTDYIDLYQSHEDDRETPLEETLETYALLIEQGKVRAIGASNYGSERLEEALSVSREFGYPRYESLQPLYNLYDRAAYEAALEPVCMKHGLGVLSYFSLARGFLTGKYRGEADLGKSPRGGGVKQYLNERGFRILSALDDVAKRCGSTPARVALAWVMARPGITAAIASATGRAQLSDLTAAAALELDAAAMEQLNRASSEDR